MFIVQLIRVRAFFYCLRITEAELLEFSKHVANCIGNMQACMQVLFNNIEKYVFIIICLLGPFF